MNQAAVPLMGELVIKNRVELLEEWKSQLSGAAPGVSAVEQEQLCSRFLELIAAALKTGAQNASVPEWQEVNRLLNEFSRARARQGFTPSQTATFVFSLKRPLFAIFQRELADRPDVLAAETWNASLLLDKLGLYTIEVFQESRDQIIMRQQQELLELSTPVVKLWDNILALPLIGTLDSSRTQVVMESLLQKIIETGAAIAIIDITGVPMVDTLVAQHLLKTVAAARLMGADCIISGIRPQIAQTIVHLGVELDDVTTKATLADAFAVALKRTGAKLAAAV